MILSKGYAVGSSINFLRRRLICFQGHYVNRHEGESTIHCQCPVSTKGQQSRNFFNLSKPSRRREYCGRQLVGYSMDQMFEVVSDIENYYNFVPWCKQSIVIKRSPGHLKADLIVGFPPINESYTSNVTLVKPYFVKAECLDGRLFHHLLTLWRFSPGLKKEQQSCVVDFQISFEFRSILHSQLSNLFFDQVARQMEGAFIREAGKRHGPATMEPRKLLLNNQTLKS